MSGRLGGLGSLLGTGLRGLRSRLLLTLGSILLAAISVGAAVVGPMYQAGAASSYLVTKLRAEPLPVIGMRLDYTPTSIPHEESYPQALDRADKLAARTLNDQFEPATLSLWTHRLSGLGGLATLMAAPGSCDHVHVVGRCPTKPGEAMILKADSAYAHVKLGDEVNIEGYPTPISIVGIYRAHPFDRDYWYDPTYFQSVPPQPTGSNGPPTPYLPAPLIVTPQSFDKMSAATWYVKATRRLHVSPTTSVADLKSAEGAVAGYQRHIRSAGLLNPTPGQLTPEQGNELLAVGHELRLREATSKSTVAPAVVSVILVALVLLVRLLSAAMDLRRAELALASLRGFSRRQMWLLGMVEPVLMLCFAVPIGAIGGILAAHWLSGLWLVPGIPLPVGAGSILALLAVLLVTLAVAALVVRESLSEPLSAQIAGVRRPGRSGRWSVLLQIVLVGAAITVLVATLARTHKSSPDATDSALPILLAVAAGLLMTLFAQWAARRWAGWTSRRRGVFGYLASRTIPRRREGTLVILPLTAALAVAIFAAGVYTAAADWRASDAATIVGADESYSTKLTLDQAVALTHQLDPAGKWIMAVGANYTPDGERLIVDAPRLPRVGVWPSSWTPGMSAADVAKALAPKRPSVLLSGSRVALTIDDQVQGDYKGLSADLEILKPDGTQTDVILGPFRHGVTTASKPLPGCRPSCLVKQLSIGGPGGLPQAMSGTATITDFRVDGRTVPGALTLPWRAAQQLLNTPAGVAGQPKIVDGGLKDQPRQLVRAVVRCHQPGRRTAGAPGHRGAHGEHGGREAAARWRPRAAHRRLDTARRPPRGECRVDARPRADGNAHRLHDADPRRHAHEPGDVRGHPGPLRHAARRDRGPGRPRHQRARDAELYARPARQRRVRARPQPLPRRDHHRGAARPGRAGRQPGGPDALATSRRRIAACGRPAPTVDHGGRGRGVRRRPGCRGAGGDRRRGARPVRRRPHRHSGVRRHRAHAPPARVAQPVQRERTAGRGGARSARDRRAGGRAHGAGRADRQPARERPLAAIDHPAEFPDHPAEIPHHPAAVPHHPAEFPDCPDHPAVPAASRTS